MDAIATHHSAPAAPGLKRSEPASKPTPSLAVLAVWEAEDGRCEACGRPMDKACACTGHDKRGQRRLMCADCKERRPDPLAAALVGPKTAGHLAEALGTTLEAASAWLTAGLRACGVLLRLQDGGGRVYWLPGVGHFSLFLDRGPDRPPLIGGPLGPLHRELEIRIKPQAHTRGLPRLRPPGTAPDQPTKDHP
jgi:hypothetical protein